MQEVNGRSCTCTCFSVPFLLSISSFNIQLQLFMCSSQSQGRDIAIEVNIQLLSIQTCLAFTVSTYNCTSPQKLQCRAKRNDALHPTLQTQSTNSYAPAQAAFRREQSKQCDKMKCDFEHHFANDPDQIYTEMGDFLYTCGVL